MLQKLDGYPGKFAATGTTVAWGWSDGPIMTLTDEGCSPQPHAYMSSEVNAEVALDGTSVYWLGGPVADPPQGTVTRGDAPGSSTVLATGQDVRGDIAAGNGYVYWTSKTSGTVMKCAESGCNDQPQVLAVGQGAPDAIALDGGNVYWLSHNADAQNQPVDSVMRCSTGGCNQQPEMLATAQGFVFSFAVAAGRLFWANASSGAILTCPENDCTKPTTLVVEGVGASRVVIAADSSFVYWADDPLIQGDFSVKGCPISGCPGSGPTVFATGQGAVIFVAVSNHAIYWSTLVKFATPPGPDQSTITRLEKP